MLQPALLSYCDVMSHKEIHVLQYEVYKDQPVEYTNILLLSAEPVHCNTVIGQDAIGYCHSSHSDVSFFSALPV